MQTYFEWIIGLRYLRSKGMAGDGRRNRFLSVISTISLIGVALGVAVLLVVLSVMNGFERELRDRILNVTAHATISGLNGTLSDWRTVRDAALKQDGVIGSAPYIEQQALLLSVNAQGDANSGAVLRGVLPAEEAQVAGLSTHMQSGAFDALRAGEFGIVIGDELAKALHVQVGDRVTAVTAQGTVTMAGVVPRSKRFTVVGIFAVGMYEYDRNYAYLHMQDAAILYRMGEAVSGVRLKVNNVFDAQSIATQLAGKLGGNYYVDDWSRKHVAIFRNIALTKSMMFLILLLVVAVAAFNVIATLVMVVKDKQSDIAILRTMGATPRQIMKVFIVQGTLIGIAGVLLGVALGTLLSWNLEGLIHGLEKLLDTQFMDAKLYFMSDLPAAVEWINVLKVAGVAFAMCCFATIYPAWRAARTEPARALRHE
ncbi:MAG: lipoprotein-releasing ABC transporter permease subunit [Steroidobacteraceae bacterium]